VESLGVIGNISRDLAIYPGGVRIQMIGGAALHIALAAAHAGLPAAPISVIGTDLGWMTSDPDLSGVAMRHVKIVSGDSCSFRLTYDAVGLLLSTHASFGVAAGLTGHALSTLGSCSACHVCCRRPLDVTSVLGRMVAMGMPFTVDFHLASADVIMPAAAAALPYARMVFVNAAEFAILSQVTDPGTLHTVVVSDGPGPASVLRCGRQVASAVPPATDVTEVTGAGDTLTGTYLAASAQGLSCDAALRKAVDAASAMVSTRGPTSPAQGE